MTSFQPGKLEQKPLPQTILDMNYAFARTAILVASVRLRLFTHLSSQALSAFELAERAGTLPEPTERLLQGLVSLGLLEKEEQLFRLTPLSEQFLVEEKPTYLGGDTLAMVDYVPAWFELDRTLRTSVAYRDLGDATTAEAFFTPRVIDLFPIIFPISSRTAKELPLSVPQDGPLRIFDVGAGSAPWSAAFALQYANVQVTALDLPAVVEEGRTKIASLGLTERYEWIAADMERVDFPRQAYDLVICGHILRFISDERARQLLIRLTESLRPGGTLLVADVFFAEGRDAPPPAVTLDLSMLVNTTGGRIRTVSEVSAWLAEMDLSSIERFHVAGPFPLIIAHKEERP